MLNVATEDGTEISPKAPADHGKNVKLIAVQTKVIGNPVMGANARPVSDVKSCIARFASAVISLWLIDPSPSMSCRLISC